MNRTDFIRITLATICLAAVSVSPWQLQAGRYYVGFNGIPNGATATYSGDNNGLLTALNAAGTGDTVFIAKGLKFYLDAELQIDEYIIGGCNPATDGLQPASRTAIGAAKSIADSMSVLDGNSLRRTLRKDKHRVATVNSGGSIENCLIRNGHARGTTDASDDLSGHGGGVLLNGGNLYNCIIRGNVAMNVACKGTNPSKGGGVYVVSGQVVNCIISFNMDDEGAGTGGTSGKIINSTIARNGNTPTYVRIAGTASYFQPSANSNPTMSLLSRYVYLDSFYIATTETTGGQYACFMSAIDYDGTDNPYLKRADADSILAAKMPTEVNYKGYQDSGGITVRDYTGFGQSISTKSCTYPSLNCWNLIRQNTNLWSGGALVNSNYVVWYPNTDVSDTMTASGEDLHRDNYAMRYVSWYGSLAFSLWLGGSLPTEAQWEYAARQNVNGTTNDSINYAGATSAGYSGLNAVAWYNGNSTLLERPKTQGVHEVGKKKPTGRGLYDMSGNLGEWVIDSYNVEYPTYAGTLVATSGGTLVSDNEGNKGTGSDALLYNPVVSSGNNRVWRGGFWGTTEAGCSLGFRGSKAPMDVGDDFAFGFRSVVCP
jgi:formylglycine-generating enzyme required for sulfatase activity